MPEWQGVFTFASQTENLNHRRKRLYVIPRTGGTVSGEMTLAEICRLEGVDYRRSIYWRARHGYSQHRQKLAPRGMVEAVVTAIPAMEAPRCAG